MTAKRLSLVAALLALLVIASAAGIAFLMLGESARAALLTDAHLPLLAVLGVAAIVVVGVGIQLLLRPHLGFVPRLTHALDVLRSANPSHRLRDEAPAPLVKAINALADDHQARLGTVEREISEATAALASERDLLAALLSELREAVLVCSADGRILLYNPRARDLLGGAVGEAGFVGLGRSVFALFRRSVILHCLDRLNDAEVRKEAQPTARAVISTRSGHFLRAVFTPLRQGGLKGFFLTLTDATSDITSKETPAQDLASLTEDGLARLTNVRAAIESLRDFPDMDGEQRARFLGIVDDESAVLTTALKRSARAQLHAAQTRWPLEEMPGETFLEIVQRRVAKAVGSDVRVQLTEPALWLRADSYAVAAAVRFVGAQVLSRQEAAGFRLRLGRSQAAAGHGGQHAVLDLLWAGSPVEPGEWHRWERAPIQLGEDALPYTLSDVARHHGGEVWPHHSDNECGVRWLLPLAEAPAIRNDQAPAEARPEFYDFNLFSPGEDYGSRDRIRLRELICTAFDTETTGLEPQGGDEIIAIGAIRVVNGRILSQEVFETMVSTRRSISPQSQRIHGITPAMLRDAPDMAQVLPRFARFCEDTVLLAHNAAFDLSFFERQAKATGVRFEQPVLDTLLLSAAVYPEREAHQLEAIAHRLGVSVVGRHTALGDAILAAEVFVRLIPLLEAKGIETLGDARSASEQTWYARLHY
jgi:DNA polymerase-3 subunit epsilon